MPIIQSSQVTAETMTLLAKKAKLEDELHKLITRIRESQESLTDMMSRQRSLEESFIGNAEWLKKIKELQSVYKSEMANLEGLMEKKDKVNDEVQQYNGMVKEITLLISRLEEQKLKQKKEIDDLNTKRDEATALLNDTLKKGVNAREELETVKREKVATAAELEKLKAEWSLECQKMGKQRLDLQVYEARILREYAILFPEVKK